MPELLDVRLIFVDQAIHEAGIASSLANLASYVEAAG